MMTKRLRREHRAEVARLTLLIGHHQELQHALEAKLAALLQVGYGIDLAHEHWELDAERGVLRRTEPEQRKEEGGDGAGNQ